MIKPKTIIIELPELPKNHDQNMKKDKLVGIRGIENCTKEEILEINQSRRYNRIIEAVDLLKAEGVATYEQVENCGRREGDG